MPIRPLEMNTPDVLMNLFLKVEQSRAAGGASLYGERFQVKVSAIKHKGLQKNKIVGSGRNKVAPIQYQISRDNVAENCEYPPYILPITNKGDK
jgi:hypothetical protein